MSARLSSRLLPVCLLASLPAQSPVSAPVHFGLGGIEVRRQDVGGSAEAAWSHDGGNSWQALRRPDDLLRLRAATFDPLVAVPSFAPPLAAPNGTRLRIVQFHTQVLEAYRTAVTAAGAEILYYLPANGLFVRGDAAVATAMAALPCVRWIGDLPNACKLEASLRALVQVGGATPIDCNLVLASKSDRVQLLGQVLQVGGQILSPCDGSVMVRATLTPLQLRSLLAFDTVLWVEPTGPDGVDMDRVRVTGGANYLEGLTGQAGQGVRIEITEAFDETHPDFLGRVLVRGTNFAFQHGHCTAGIAAGSGVGNLAARGLLPDSLLIEGAYGSSSHYAQIQGSVDPSQPWRAMLATASWGATYDTSYNAVSMAMDDALFDADLARTQSMGNNGVPVARPEAWAKNIVSVGGIKHLDDLLVGNDRWNMVGDFDASSIGPAADGRLKPDVVGYYDSILCSDLPGALGYDPGDYFASFSGSSAATPIVAGHLGLLQQMFTDGMFGNRLPLAATAANRFANRPHMSTSKALLCNTAQQYPFAGLNHDLTRTHQGWGFPDVRRAHEQSQATVVLDEYDTLQLGQAREYWVQVLPGTPEFRATMVYADPAAAAGVTTQLVNDLDLKVTRVADGAFWWGNNGLATGTASISGGAPDDRDTIECVYLANPQPGTYTVRVEAAAIVQDGKVETPALDADFALVMHPVGGYRNDSGPRLEMKASAPGDLTLVCANMPVGGWTEGHTVFSVTSTRPLGFGRFFGIEDDFASGALWVTPAFVDNPFHFLPGGTNHYPYVPFAFDPAFINWLALYQLQLDAVVLLWNGNDIVAVSNTARAQLQ